MAASPPSIANHPFPLLTTPLAALPPGQEPDMYTHIASDMAVIHNVMLRGLNAVHQQAPHVTPADAPAFAHFAYCFYDLLHHHHEHEERTIFPRIEALAGEPGLMARNVAQHHAFAAGLDAYGAYVRDCVEGREVLDGKKLVDIIDGFGAGLRQHLGEEIGTLEGLRAYEAARPEMETLGSFLNEVDGEHMKKFAVAGTLSWGIFNHDVAYEGGLWSKWPPAPWVLMFVVRNVTFRLHSDWWKFAPCDSAGRLKAKLYATGED